jgi:GTP-binding protein
VLLLVDAAEGPMPQTRFVTRKALELGLQPVVVINKVDRADARSEDVHDEVLELFMDLEADDHQLDAPFLYASGREGWAVTDVAEVSGALATSEIRSSVDTPSERTSTPEAHDLTSLFETIVSSIPPPTIDTDGPFQMLVSTLDFSPYVGRIGIGRVERGRVQVGDQVALLPLGNPGLLADDIGDEARVVQLYGFDGLERVDVREAEAGDIVALAGLEGVEIGRTLTDPAHRERLLGIAVEEPTLSVDFLVNNSPFSGQSGKYVTTRQLRERLFKELERNVALKVEETELPDTFTVSGRGELHLAILMETMRREGYEFQVSRPRVILHAGPSGEPLEPYEEAIVDLPEGMMGVVMEKMGPRRGELIRTRHTALGSIRLAFRIPARGLFGYRSEFLTDTRGEGILHHRFLEYGPWAGELTGRRRGVLVADRTGEAVGYALFNLQERATMFVEPGTPVYQGMIVGEHVRPGDMDVNATKEKKLSNIRTTAADEAIRLEPPRPVTLELGLEFIENDELIEVTPDAIRLRKRVLDAQARKKAQRKQG